MWWKSRFLSRFCFKWTHDVKSKYFCNEYRAVLALITSIRWLNPDLCPPPRNINSKSLLQVTGKDSGRKAKYHAKSTMKTTGVFITVSDIKDGVFFGKQLTAEIIIVLNPYCICSTTIHFSSALHFI